jgi:hypothetical protein
MFSMLAILPSILVRIQIPRHIKFSLKSTDFKNKFCVTILFCKHFFSLLNTFIRKEKDPDPYLWLTEPDPGGPKTCWSRESGSASPTPLPSLNSTQVETRLPYVGCTGYPLKMTNPMPHTSLPRPRLETSLTSGLQQVSWPGDVGGVLRLQDAVVDVQGQGQRHCWLRLLEFCEEKKLIQVSSLIFYFILHFIHIQYIECFFSAID